MKTSILQVCFLGDSLKLRFLTRYLYFSPQLVKRKRNKNEVFNNFWRMLLKFEWKNLKTHKHSWLIIIWIFKKLNSIQTLVKNIPEIILSHWSLLSKTYKKSHYRESTVAAPISSLALYNKVSIFSPGWQYRFYFKIY